MSPFFSLLPRPRPLPPLARAEEKQKSLEKEITPIMTKLYAGGAPGGGGGGGGGEAYEEDAPAGAGPGPKIEEVD